MSLSVKTLVEQVAKEMQLDGEAQNQLLALAESWESVLETMAEIEPDDDYEKDRPRLEKLRPQEDTYDDMRGKASKPIKEAMSRYLSLRNLDKRNKN